MSFVRRSQLQWTSFWFWSQFIKLHKINRRLVFRLSVIRVSNTKPEFLFASLQLLQPVLIVGKMKTKTWSYRAVGVVYLISKNSVPQTLMVEVIWYLLNTWKFVIKCKLFKEILNVGITDVIKLPPFPKKENATWNGSFVEFGTSHKSWTSDEVLLNVMLLSPLMENWAKCCVKLARSKSAQHTQFNTAITLW